MGVLRPLTELPQGTLELVAISLASFADLRALGQTCRLMHATVSGLHFLSRWLPTHRPITAVHRLLLALAALPAPVQRIRRSKANYSVSSIPASLELLELVVKHESVNLSMRPEANQAAFLRELHSASGGDVNSREASSALSAAAGIRRQGLRFRSSPPLVAAAKLSLHAACQVLLDAGAPVHSTCILQYTALHEASSLQVIQVLIAAGADVNAGKTSHGWTPLHAACSRNDAAAVGALIAAGADVRVQTIDTGETPLHVAMVYYTASNDCTKLLVKAGANPRVADVRGTTPYSMAQRLTRNSKRLVKLFDAAVPPAAAAAAPQVDGL